MARTKPPSFDFFVDDFIAGTYHLPAEAVGIYVRLLCYQWNNGSIPDDHEQLARVGGVDTDVIRTYIRIIYEKFQKLENGYLQNERMERERLHRLSVIEKSKAAINSRWSKEKAGRQPENPSQATNPADTSVHTPVHTSVSTNVIPPTPNTQPPTPNKLNTPLIPQGGDAPTDVPSTGKKPKRVRNQETVGEWSIPHGWDSEKLRDALGAFERMRTSIGHRIKDRANLSRVFKSFDNAEHLIYAIDFATSNEYQGIKPDYRPPVTKPEPKKEKELPMITELPPEIVAIYTRQAEERRKRNEEFERKRHDESMRGGVNLRDPNTSV